MRSNASASIHPAFKFFLHLLFMFVTSVFWLLLIFCLVSCCSILGGVSLGKGVCLGFFNKLGISRESQIFLLLTCLLLIIQSAPRVISS